MSINSAKPVTPRQDESSEVEEIPPRPPLDEVYKSPDAIGTATEMGWAGLTLGGVLLSCSPLLMSGIRWAELWPDFLPWDVDVGLLLGTQTAPAMVIAILVTVSWRPIWQRMLLYAPILALALTSWLWHIGLDVRTALDSWPVCLMSATLPVFVMRVWKHWTVVPPERNFRVPASVATLLAAMSFWGFAIAYELWNLKSEQLSGVRNSPLDWIARNDSVYYLVIVALGTMLTACLCAVLGKLRRQRWIGAAVALLVAIFATIALGFVAWSLAKILATATIYTALCGIVSFYWLRILGYRLVGRSDNR